MKPEELQAIIDAVLEKAGLNQVPNRFVPGEGGTPQPAGAFKTFGEFLRTVKYRPSDPRLRGQFVEEKALSEGTDSAGGFLVPDAFRADLLQLAMESAIVRPRAMTIPMTTNLLKIPKLTETSRASTVFGGVVAYWEGEGDTHTASQPAFGQVQLQPKKLVGYTQASDELLADSAIAMEALLRRVFAEAIAFYEDDAFLWGTGAGMPLGITNSGAVVSVAKEANQAADTIVAGNINKMYSRMLPSSLSRAVWVAQTDTLPQLLPLMDPLTTSNPVGAPGMTLRGRPVLLTEKLATLGDQYDILFVDFSYYLLGDRQSLIITSSEHVLFTTDQTVWKFVLRVDGQPWLNAALTPKRGSNTLSPFVALDARA